MNILLKFDLVIKEKLIIKYILISFFFISLSVRVYASFLGGQFFIVDELRYRAGHHLLSFISDLNINDAIIYILNNPAHTFFIFFASFFELIRYVIIHLFINSSVPPHELNITTIGISYSASLNSLFSSINIILIYSIVRSFGGSKVQALIASFFLLLSITNFYFSRHLVPYDIALTLSLTSFYFSSLGNKGSLYQFTCGMFAGISTLTYFGYWPLSLIAWIVCICRSKTKTLKLFFWCSLGGLTPLLLLQSLGYMVGLNYLRNVWEFVLATESNQMGDPNSGIEVFFDYMWKTDNILFLFMLFFSGLSFFYIKFSYKFNLNHRSFGLFTSVLILSILFYLSQVEGNFVLYGRTVKMAIPFLCIACSYPLFVFLKISKIQIISRFVLVSFLILLIFSILNHNKVLNIVYPQNFREEAQKISNKFEEVSTFTGKSVHKLERRDPHAPYSLVNAQWLVPPLTETVQNIPKGKLLLKSLHPYSAFPPYLFLHYNNEERTIIQKKNLEMLFIQKYE
jgi:hypothetical protein